MSKVENIVSSIAVAVTASVICVCVFLTKKAKLDIVKAVSLEKIKNGETFQLEL